LGIYFGRFHYQVAVRTRIQLYPSSSGPINKMVHFIPTTERISAEGLARLFRDNMWKLHGLPESIISDRGPQFTAGIMRELNGILEIKSKISMVFHP